MSRHPLTWVPGDAVPEMVKCGFKVLRVETPDGPMSVKTFLEDAKLDLPTFYRRSANITLKRIFVLMHKGGQSETHKSLVRKQP
jgi:hypothetical protein